ncbi:MAG: DUF1799 domain-containing protein [Proteobacteria bacterium]|nr:DUF1799 domain-containing protein [Pseudomonadota bacterium]MCL2306764.1 DUF1799 domain-containing protein [Pseudomonadota bacterium]
MADQLRASGASEEVISEVLRREFTESEEYEIYQENIEAVGIFMRLHTQWRVVSVGMSGALVRLGLDYNTTAAYLDAVKVEDKHTMMLKLQIMESAAMQVFNAKCNAKR